MSLIEKLKDAGFYRQAEILESCRLPCVKIKTTKADEAAFRLGESKFGGLPHLPADFEWPMYNGKPLAFIAQFNLADVAAYDTDNKLPHEGILYFFYEGGEEVWGYDPKDADGFRVYHHKELAVIEATALPEGVPEDALLSPCKLEFSADVSYPMGEVLDGVGLDPETLKEFMTIERADIDEFDEIIEEYVENHLFGEYDHQLLGYPNLVQGEIFHECQLASNGLFCGDESGYRDPREKALRDGAKDWTLLFQIDSDDNAEVMWGDCGMVYFAIRKADLAAADFSWVWAVFQCC
ncbi:MAG: DUF1963 domain-containing protein [Synergistaceae bacterium]|jgi:uncharacterized protein YwqG|nr:DUF1963 domain-containing protein [Synergistaceae bacterium]